MERVGNFFFRYRDAISPLFFAVMLVLTRPVQPQGSPVLDAWLDFVGLLMASAGEALRIAVVGYAYIIRGGKAGKVYAEDLVTGGFFASSRNPLYVGNLLIIFGLFLIWNSWWLYALGVPFFLFAYRAIVAAEEAFLRRKFGTAYAAYCRHVRRWIPNLSHLASALEGMAFNWRRVLLKEYGTVAAWVGTALVLMMAETLYFAPFRASQWRLGSLLGATALLVVLWGFTRWLKLSRRLRA